MQVRGSEAREQGKGARRGSKARKQGEGQQKESEQQRFLFSLHHHPSFSDFFPRATATFTGNCPSLHMESITSKSASYRVLNLEGKSQEIISSFNFPMNLSDIHGCPGPGRMATKCRTLPITIPISLS